MQSLWYNKTGLPHLTFFQLAFPQNTNSKLPPLMGQDPQSPAFIQPLMEHRLSAKHRRIPWGCFCEPARQVHCPQGPRRGLSAVYLVLSRQNSPSLDKSSQIPVSSPLWSLSEFLLTHDPIPFFSLQHLQAVSCNLMWVILFHKIPTDWKHHTGI